MEHKENILGKNKLKLGIFSANCSSGMAVTKVPERWENNWDNNLKLVKQCDEAGIEFMLPIARWIGYGGETNFHGNVLETVTWAAGLVAHSKNIQVFATIHTAFNHPIVSAKQLATLDQLSGGRIGLNVVAGWNKPEYDAFGIELPSAHDKRYKMAQEWFDYVSKLWTEDEPFDWEGDFFRGKDVSSLPHPVKGQMPILNAASSEEGKNFAMRNADFLYTPMLDYDHARTTVKDVEDRAKSVGRKVGVLSFVTVVCRPTMKEAEDYLAYYADEHADWEAVDNLMTLQGMHAQSFSRDALATLRDRFAAGHGGFPLVGTPEHIANLLEKISGTGVAGVALAFVDYAKEFPYFQQEVLPRLEKKGLRAAFRV